MDTPSLTALSDAEPEIFPIVGIGASAGGLDAIRRLLSRLETNLGMAYVFVQHLAPTRESLLPGLLARMTVLPVQEVRDGMRIVPDTVYVAPAGVEVKLVASCFTTRSLSLQEGQRTTIDHFFTSLTETSKNGVIGVVLSGTASDGVAGLKAIKAVGGITFAQDEASASFPQMPHNAVAAGCVDAVLSPEAIAESLGRLSRTPHLRYSLTSGPVVELPVVEPSFTRLLVLLKTAYGVDFLSYKPSTLLRRIQQRMDLLALASISIYTSYVGTHPAELEKLFQHVLIPTTSFFRDPEVYTTLVQRVVPSLREHRSPDTPLRIWVPACSTGEEAYSLLICLLDAAATDTPTSPVQVFATDINLRSLAFARTGIYSASQVKSISAERRERFFIPVDQTCRFYQVRREVREQCIFATHNLLKDPPFSHLDLLSCRNLLIYLQAHAQEHVLQTLHYALRPEGVLLLGTSESVDPLARHFRPIERHQKLYRKKVMNDRPLRPFPIIGEAARQHLRPEGGTEVMNEEHVRMDWQRVAERVLLSQYVSASVVCDEEMEILSFHGHTGPYLEPAPGKSSFNLLRMARPGLVSGIKAAFAQTRASRGRVTREGLQVQIDGTLTSVRLSVLPLVPASEPLYFLVIFEKIERLPTDVLEDAPRNAGARKGRATLEASEARIAALEQEVEELRADLTTMLEEHQAALEELQTSNEEARSSNEELQSLNEELETSKEELQVINEELATTNEELQSRYEQARVAQEYAEAVVETVREPLLVLSKSLRVERANAAFYSVFQTTKAETEGYWFYDLFGGQWHIPRLRQLLEQILPSHQSLQDFEVEHSFPKVGRKVLLLNARQVLNISEQEKNHLILLAMEDITERRDLGRQKEALLMVSHELRTPLTSALLYTELLHEIFERAGNEQALSYLQKVIEQHGHLNHFIGDLLDATATEAGTLHLRPTTFVLSEVVQHAVEMLQQANPQARLLIEGEMHTSVFADRERIGQVLINLLSNAIKYGTSALPISVRIEVSDRLVTMRVQDHGNGIPAEQRERVFERFYRGTNTEHSGVPGLGLGLYLASKLVKASGGEIWVESVIGSGTTFSFTLPRGDQTP